MLEKDGVAPPLVRHHVRHPREVGCHLVHLQEVGTEDNHVTQRMAHHKLRVANLHDVHRLARQCVAEEGAVEVVRIHKFALECIGMLLGVACVPVEMKRSHRPLHHLAFIPVLGEQDEVQVERRLRLAAADKVIAIGRLAYISHQQLTVAVRVPVTLASQDDGPVGGAVVV